MEARRSRRERRLLGMLSARYEMPSGEEKKHPSDDYHCMFFKQGKCTHLPSIIGG